MLTIQKKRSYSENIESLQTIVPSQAETDLKNAKAQIVSLQLELAKVKFENTALREENERVNYLY